MSQFTSDDVKRNQRTEKGLKFEKWYDEVRNLLSGKTQENKKKALAANAAFCRGIGMPTKTGSDIGYIGKAVNPGAVHIDTLLSTFSTMYANDEFIGLRLMPVLGVDKRSNKFAVYPKRERFAFPDDAITTRSVANEIEATRSTDNYSVDDYALKNFLDLETIVNEDAPLDEMLDLAEAVNEGIAFREEKRIATIVQTSGNYGSNTSGATSVWSNTTTGGTIISDMLAAKQAIWRGRNQVRLIGVTTLSNWNSCLINNPQLNAKYNYTQAGLLTPQLIAGWFGLDEILIGSPREDTANEGQTASFARIWTSNFFAIISVATRPTLRSLCFGNTYRLNEDPITTEWFDPEIGKKGGNWLKVGLSEVHKVVAGDAAYYISTVQ